MRIKRNIDVSNKRQWEPDVNLYWSWPKTLGVLSCKKRLTRNIHLESFQCGAIISAAQALCFVSYILLSGPGLGKRFTWTCFGESAEVLF